MWPRSAGIFSHGSDEGSFRSPWESGTGPAGSENFDPQSAAFPSNDRTESKAAAAFGGGDRTLIVEVAAPDVLDQRQMKPVPRRLPVARIENQHLRIAKRGQRRRAKIGEFDGAQRRADVAEIGPAQRVAQGPRGGDSRLGESLLEKARGGAVQINKRGHREVVFQWKRIGGIPEESEEEARGHGGRSEQARETGQSHEGSGSRDEE